MKTFLRLLILLRKYVYLLTLFSSNTFFISAQSIDFGKSYINVTKGLNGGTVEPGDTLEIRASFVVRSGTFDSCGYFDAVPAGTTFLAGTIRVLTNEGKIYKQFTDAAGDDCGWITGGNIRINLGFVAAAAPATAFRRGRVVNTHKPSFFGGTCIMIASFRIRVTAGYGSNISTGGGSMTYKNGVAAVATFVFPSNIIRVFNNYAICSNTVGTNALGTEVNGTFGSGKPRNRGTSANVPPGYTYSPFNNNMPNDYYYGIANNTSTQTYSTLNTWPKPDPDPDGAGPLTTHRVFGVWDIIGDHTGAVSPTLGNPAADTVANSNGGYMLVINAAYRIDSAFQHTISGLCPNTYYEISCWMRNICSKCGCDSNGTGASGGAAYIPTAPGDSSGVYPNLTFDLDGIDYYTTGNLRYSGLWVKKGFTFLTGMAQTSFTLKFFNNASGGGGNDWALDDITIATCTPNLVLLPSPNPMVCANNVVNMSCTVKSFFNNYTYYKWQKSIDGGATWLPDGPPSGPAVPTWSGSDWQYTVAHPAFVATMVDNGSKYRIVVATTLGNLSTAGCFFSEATVITLNVIDCGNPLSTNLLSFTGKLVNEKAELNWATSKENEILHFIVEKSLDGMSFDAITTINNHNDPSKDINTYSFTDPIPVNGIVYYRIKMVNDQGNYEYSRVIQLSNKNTGLAFGSVINPFSHKIEFELLVSSNGKAYVELIDQEGRIIKRNSFVLNSGVNNLTIQNMNILASGIYTLRVQFNGLSVQKRLMKTNQQ